MDIENLNKNEGVKNNSSDSIKKIPKKKGYKSKKFSTTFIYQNSLNKDLNKMNKSSSKDLNKMNKSISKDLDINNSKFLSYNPSFIIKSQKELRNFRNSINLNGISLHDAIFLGKEQNNKGIKTNDISCYLSNISMQQPEDPKYKIIEKNIQHKLLDMSIEIFQKNKTINNNELNHNNTYKWKKKRKKSSNKVTFHHFKDKDNKLKLSQNYLPIKQSISIKSHDTSSFLCLKELQIEKMRKIVKKKVLYDSLAEDESDENIEEDGFGLNPESVFIDIFDTIMLICSLFCLFYIPFKLAESKLIIKDNDYLILFMIYFSEIIYIFDLIFGFFRWYYNNELKLVRNKNMIIKNYLLGDFLMDFMLAIPFYTILRYGYLNNDKKLMGKNEELFNEKHFTIKIFTCFKALKIFKINDRRNNRAIHYLNKKFSDNYISERIYQISNFIIITISVLNIFIYFHIYIGKLSYPNWIFSFKVHDKSFIEVYLVSLYFIMATMTSVGYGDIVCISKEETCFQIILLSIGIVAYSWIISTVGDYVKNESRATIKYNKDVAQLEEIRIAYPNMPFKLYNKIHQHLHRSLIQQEKYDSNLLINSLPYTLKNTLIFEIHKDVINKFTFFNGCENSAFILKVITHFIPLISKNNAFLIKEGEIIENIFFVKDGKLSLEAAIDLDNIEESIEKYLEYQFEDISSLIESDDENENSLNNISSEIKIKKKEKNEKKKKIKTFKDLFNIISKQTQLIGDISYMHESHIEEEIGKCDFNEGSEDLDLSNLQFLHILDILKNEYFGEIYMFLSRPCPLSLRVKSKKADLFLLRKKDAINIRKDYPNIWKRIDDKSMHNMKSIKALTKKVINRYCIMNGIIQEKEILERFDHLFGFKESDKNTQTQNIASSNTIRSQKSKKRIGNVITFKKNNIDNCSVLNKFKINKKKNINSAYTLINNTNILNRRGSINIPKYDDIKNEKKKRGQSLTLKTKNNKGNDDNTKEKEKINKGKSWKIKRNKNINLEKNNKTSTTVTLCKNDDNYLNNKNNIDKNIKNSSLSEKKIIINKISDKNNISKFSKKHSIDNCSVSIIPLNAKNSINNSLNLTDKSRSLKNANRSNLFFSSKNILSQIQDNNDNDSSMIYSPNLIQFTQESTVKLEILSSYRNINNIAKGKYISNKNFQKATQKFINYYTNSILKDKEIINNKEKIKESSFELSSFNHISSEESVIKKNNSILYNNKINSDKKTKKLQKKIVKLKSSNDIKCKLPINNIKIEEKDFESKNKYNKSNKIQINKMLGNNNLYINQNTKISLLKENKNELEQPKNTSIISISSEVKNNDNDIKKDYDYNSFYEEENIIDNINNKKIDLFTNHCNSDAKLTNNINNPKFQLKQKFFDKKDKIQNFIKLNENKKDEKITYNSSQNIINNKSNKNINEVNINFTNNFCLIS